jgi:hypothetical protein
MRVFLLYLVSTHLGTLTVKKDAPFHSHRGGPALSHWRRVSAPLSPSFWWPALAAAAQGPDRNKKIYKKLLKDTMREEVSMRTHYNYAHI